MQVAVKMTAAPENGRRDELTLAGRSPLQGLVVATLSPAVADEAGVLPDATGVVALSATQGPASRFFRRGDIIVAVNDARISTVRDLEKATQVDVGVWRIVINRQGRNLQLTLR